MGMADVLAVEMLLMLVGTLAVGVRWGIRHSSCSLSRRMIHWGPGLLSFFGLVVMWLIVAPVVTSSFHCPMMPVLLCACCVTLVLALVADVAVRRWTVLVLLLGVTGMWVQFVGIVDTGRYHVPYQDRIAFNARYRQHFKLEAIRGQLLQLAEHDTTRYPAGWLRTLPMGRKIDASRCEDIQSLITPLWNSRFTWLYGVRRVPAQVWYPGGRLQDAATQVRFERYPEGPR